MKDFLLSILVWLGTWKISEVQALTDILLNLGLFVATIVAGWWAYTTLAYKEKVEEFKAIAKKIAEIHSHIEMASERFSMTQTLVGLAGLDEGQLRTIKYEAEGKLGQLKSELEELQAISLSVPFVFRMLDLTIYQSEFILLGGVENWVEEDTKAKLYQAKLEILKNIDREINAHGNLLKLIKVKIQNATYRIANVGKALRIF